QHLPLGGRGEIAGDLLVDRHAAELRFGVRVFERHRLKGDGEGAFCDVLSHRISSWPGWVTVNRCTARTAKRSLSLPKRSTRRRQDVVRAVLSPAPNASANSRFNHASAGS